MEAAANLDQPTLEQAFTLPQLEMLSGIDARTLHNWVGRGLIEPSHQRASGSGTTNLFDSRDAVVSHVLGELRRNGNEIKVLEQASVFLYTHFDQLRPHGYLLIADEAQYVESAEKLAPGLQTTGPALVYSLRDALELV